MISRTVIVNIGNFPINTIEDAKQLEELAEYCIAQVVHEHASYILDEGGLIYCNKKRIGLSLDSPVVYDKLVIGEITEQDLFLFKQAVKESVLNLLPLYFNLICPWEGVDVLPVLDIGTILATRNNLIISFEGYIQTTEQ